MRATDAVLHFVSYVLATAIVFVIGYEVAVANTSFVPGHVGAMGCMCPVMCSVSGSGISPFLVFMFIVSFIGVGWFLHDGLVNPDE